MRKLLIISSFFSLCLLQTFAQEVEALKGVAQSMVDQNRPDEAAKIYEQILLNDSMYVESYSFLGNYYYLLGANAESKQDAQFKTIPQPTRMQVARYQDELKKVYYAYYAKADVNLRKANALRNNDHLQKLQDAIHSFMEKLGLNTTQGKKKKIQ